MKKPDRTVRVGETTYRLASLGQNRGYWQTPCVWVCTTCGSKTPGTPERPWYADTACARNGHAPCRLCGKQLARLNCGCPREHAHNRCPAKTEGDRMQPQHAHKGHLVRPEAS